ncbi:hypothetical protein KIW84_051849 [Lathyrus oleraceus]|uniref:Uncharacterized protein n=1 Tax=Pisum sativum TaxID=3888 RepID=A0A9D4WQI7_PEA|nr:hypothetical protein KIW84_051849 [Pisum sativum]
MKNSGSQMERVKYCLRPAMTNKIRLIIHHSGKLVETPVKWYYWNSAYNFSRGLRPLNNGKNVLHFSKDVVGYDVIDVYVEHNVGIPEIIDDNELDAEDDAQCTGFKSADVTEEVTIDPNIVVEQVTTDPNVVVEEVTIDPNVIAEEGTTDPNGIVENDVITDPNIVAEEGTTDPNGVVEDDVTTDPNVVAEEFTTDIDEDYVASQGSFEDSEFQFSEEYEESEMDWTKLLPEETLGEVSSCQNRKDQAEMVHDESED